MQNFDTQTILLVAVGVTALAVLLQAITLLVMFVALRKAAHALQEEVEDLRATVTPVFERTQELLARVGPKAEAAATDLAAVAHGLRSQAEHLEATAKEIIERAHQQSNRVDAMFTSVLDAVDRAGGFLADAVSKPARQLAGLLASARAIIESLRSPAPAQRPAAAPEGEDKPA